MQLTGSIKTTLFILMGSLVAGCSSTTWDAVYSTWELSGSGKKDTKLTDDYVKSLPYASLLVAVEPRTEALLVLESMNGKQLQWRANNGSIIVTEGGRVVSAQIEEINYRILASTHDPVRQADWQHTQAYRLTMDMPHLGVYQQTFQCQLRISEQAPQPFTTPLRTGKAQQYIEDCQLSDGRFVQKNQYWVDIDSGALVKAKQHFHPKLPGAIVFSEAKPLGWRG